MPNHIKKNTFTSHEVLGKFRESTIVLPIIRFANFLDGNNGLNGIYIRTIVELFVLIKCKIKEIVY